MNDATDARGQYLAALDQVAADTEGLLGTLLGSTPALRGIGAPRSA